MRLLPVNSGHKAAAFIFVKFKNVSKSIERSWLSYLLTATILILSSFPSSGTAGNFSCISLFNVTDKAVVSVAVQEKIIPKDSAETSKPWFWRIQFKRTEKTLSYGKIISVTDLKSALKESGKEPSGTTVGMALIVFADGTRAIWKPGLKNRTEVAAYRAARAVGSRLIPPTVERTVNASDFEPSVPSEIIMAMNGQLGSLQYFVSTPYDLLKIGGTERAKIWEKVPIAQKAQRDIFNFVFGNWDLHWGNILIDETLSIVQIDNGEIRARQKVRYGELPFIRRLGFSAEAKKKLIGVNEGGFPFDSAIKLNNPSILQVIAAIRNYVEPKDLATFIKARLKNFKNPNLTKEAIEKLTEGFAELIRQQSNPTTLEDYFRDYLLNLTPTDLSMQIVFWDKGVWIQAIGFQNYKPIIPPIFQENVLNGYRALTFDILRSIFPIETFSDQAIKEMLSRRDQILSVADRNGSVH